MGKIINKMKEFFNKKINKVKKFFNKYMIEFVWVICILVIGGTIFTYIKKCEASQNCLRDVLSVVTAAATCTAVIYAYKAWIESLKTRKSNSFNNVLTQFINMHPKVFRNDRTSKTDIYLKYKIHAIIYGIRTNENVFRNLCVFYEHKYKKKEINGVEDIVAAYKEYMSLIKDNAEFSHCFKFLYTEITSTIEKIGEIYKGEPEKADKEIENYIDIIQSMLSYDELICYVINLIQHHHRHNREDSDNYRALLCKYKFFENLKQCREGERQYDLLIHLVNTVNCIGYLRSMGIDWHHPNPTPIKTS